jgi:hypothetical protein
MAQCSGFGPDHFAVLVVTASAADVMRTLLFAAIRAFGVGRWCQAMMRTAHVPLRRRGFSFGDRHRGNSLKRPGDKPTASATRAQAFRRGGQNKARSEQETAAGFKPKETRGIAGPFCPAGALTAGNRPLLLPSVSWGIRQSRPSRVFEPRFPEGVPPRVFSHSETRIQFTAGTPPSPS